MGFFDEYVDKGGNFLNEEPKQRIIRDKTPLLIRGVNFKAQAKFGPTYFCDVVVLNEAKVLTFRKDSVPSRDRQLDAMIVWLRDENNALPVIVLEQAGKKKPILIVDASDQYSPDDAQFIVEEEETLDADEVAAALAGAVTPED